ncbi:GvpL/GvpF family gas vesicle protein [Streptomyces maoxianensis]|uniref:GvpL/GvpF family gas vesicle protein n=1 Tax=Streptomyces maoxianensis TaxID=1459942 RepID=A0ABV9G0R1_9ACTN
MNDAVATWLYAVAPTAGTSVPAGLKGVAGEPVRVIEGAGLSAVVGSVPLSDFGEEELRAHLEDLPWLEAAVRAHHWVIDNAARSGCVVPLRFATMYRDDARIRSLLDERRADFDSVLDLLAGRTEWGVKAYVDPQAFVPDSQGDRTGGRSSPGTAYLLRRKEQQRGRETAHARATECAEAIHAALAELAVRTAEHPPQDARLAEYEGWMVLNNSYLVPDPRVEKFAAAVASLEQRFPEIRLELSGPWPAYSFTAISDSGQDSGQEGESRAQ